MSHSENIRYWHLESLHFKKGNFIISDPKLMLGFQLESWIKNQRLPPNCQTWSKSESLEVATAPFKVAQAHKKVCERLFTQQRDSDKEPRAVCNAWQSLCLPRSSLGLVWHHNPTLEADHTGILNSFITGAD